LGKKGKENRKTECQNNIYKGNDIMICIESFCKRGHGKEGLRESNGRD
jgi:hypothetical protein